jgi:hypothetical protein
MNNLQKFKNIGIQPYEIIVVVIFDGLHKMNNSENSTQSMIKLFEEYDLRIGLKVKSYKNKKSLNAKEIIKRK